MGFQSKGDHAMRYLLMCYFDEQWWEQMPAAQKGKLMEEYSAFAQGIVQPGHFRASAKRQPTSTSTTVREQNGKRVTTDGPFAETKAQLGGASLVECQDRDEAMALAGCIPTLRAGGAIEVRPVAWTSQP
jgi:hypothetical protein